MPIIGRAVAALSFTGLLPVMAAEARPEFRPAIPGCSAVWEVEPDPDTLFGLARTPAGWAGFARVAGVAEVSSSEAAADLSSVGAWLEAVWFEYLDRLAKEDGDADAYAFLDRLAREDGR